MPYPSSPLPSQSSSTLELSAALLPLIEANPALVRMLTPKTTKYIPHRPTEKQRAFLLLDCPEAFYGGAAGGGKSDALLAAALQWVDVPSYNALLLRRTFADLSLPGALMDRAADWLGGTDAVWHGNIKAWRFPSGASLQFGYLESENDRFRYQSAEFQFIGFDELTQFTERQYLYLFSRLRRLAGLSVPLRMRSASNPGGPGHEWVKQRFIMTAANTGRVFIPARMEDNPHLDIESYRKALQELDAVTRAQLQGGDWDVSHTGAMFQREFFKYLSIMPSELRTIRMWDLAATEKPRGGGDPDFTVGTLIGLLGGRWYIADVRRVQATPYNVERLIRSTAETDGKGVPIWIEQEGGGSGKALLDGFKRGILAGYDVHNYRPLDPKPVRAKPVSSAAEAGNITLLRAGWNPAFLDEFETFPLGAHDDIVDTVSAGFEVLTPKKAGKAGTVRYA